MIKQKLKVYPLDKSRWNDLVKLFGKNGACGGCWCMTWRLKNIDYQKQKGDGNKKSLKKLVDSGRPVGVLGYFDGEPVGWCSVAPREDFVKLANSKVLQRIDDEPVWSVSCLFILKEFRNKGMSTALLKGAIKFCKTQNAKIIEGYPVVPKKDKMPDIFAWTGILSAYLKAGFKEIIRRSETRPVVRYFL
jgi:GNAT superfamily N-acetyltransferase